MRPVAEVESWFTCEFGDVFPVVIQHFPKWEPNQPITGHDESEICERGKTSGHEEMSRSNSRYQVWTPCRD